MLVAVDIRLHADREQMLQLARLTVVCIKSAHCCICATQLCLAMRTCPSLPLLLKPSGRRCREVQPCVSRMPRNTASAHGHTHMTRCYNQVRVACTADF
jgi:hypothetical protein